MMIKVYFASKLEKAPLWRRICSENKTFIAHARWLKHRDLKTDDSKEDAQIFWIEDEQDVLSSDVLVVYGTEEEHLRGALVEAGMAIAKHIPVLLVGDHKDYGTWQFHPGCRKVRDIEELVVCLKEISERKSTAILSERGRVHQ